MKNTIKDVAEVAGVSVKTVSRVLNDEKYVSADLRQRVEGAIARLNFRPSLVARMLRRQRSFQIALIYDNPNPYFVYNVQEGVRACCAERGYRMLVQPCSIHSPTLVDDLGSLIEQTHLDGLILTPPVTDSLPALEELGRRGIRHVRIAPGTNLMATPSVHIDNVAAADEMTRHLLDLGHRRIGFVVGHPAYITSNQRLLGYRDALRRAGVAYDPELVRPGQFNVQSGVGAAEALFALANAPTAIFASNDDMAAGVLATALRRGMTVPDDLSIAGFDDTELAQSVWPPLTTIHQPFRDIGYAAADVLLSEDGNDGPERRRLEYRLVVRESTAAPRS